LGEVPLHKHAYPRESEEKGVLSVNLVLHPRGRKQSPRDIIINQDHHSSSEVIKNNAQSGLDSQAAKYCRDKYTSSATTEGRESTQSQEREEILSGK